VATLALGAAAPATPDDGWSADRTAAHLSSTDVTATQPAPGLPAFSYGFDLAKQGPYLLPTNDPGAVVSARAVMASSPMVMVQQLMGSGVGNPEPSPGVYEFGGVDRGVHLITSTGGTPVITLFGAPDWMKGQPPGTTNWALQNMAPLPQYYQDFANLAATVALRYKQVKYFIVWKELQGFFVKSSGTYDITDYTILYNDVYTAIKAVRPDALVGGPYTPLESWSTHHGYAGPRPSGPWGYADWGELQTLSYFLQHAVGVDFLALDAPNYTKDKGLLTDPVTSDAKYAAIDQWIRAQTPLPLWWVEGPVGVQNPGQMAAAARVGALLEMAASGAQVGLQWQPQEGAGINGEGVWTSTASPGGGQPTLLAKLLPALDAVLHFPVTLEAGQPTGVVVASGAGGTVAVNGSPQSQVAVLGTGTVTLASGGISIGDTPGPPVVTALTPADGAVSVAFDAPTFTGNSPLTGYTVDALDVTNPADGGQTASGPTSPLIVTGLTNGDMYQFTVSAADAAGTGPTSPLSATVVPEPPPPVVTAVLGGPLAVGAHGVALVVDGTGFMADATLRVPGGGVVLSNVAVIGPSTIVATVAVGASAATGARDVTVVSPAGAVTCTGCLTVLPAPTLSLPAPLTIDNGGEVPVAFTASGVEPGATFALTGPGTGIRLLGVAPSATGFTATAEVSPTAPPGSYTVKATNSDNSVATCAGCLTVAPAPQLTGVTPALLAAGARETFQLSGSGIEPGATLRVVGSAGKVAAAAVVVTSSTLLTARLVALTDAVPSSYAVTVVNPDHTSATCAGCLTVIADPTFTVLVPSVVAPDQTVPVQLTGTGFAPGATVTGPADTVFSRVVVSGPGTITADLKVASDAAAGISLPVRVANDAAHGGGRVVADILTIS
jgi:hypothetical protein